MSTKHHRIRSRASDAEVAHAYGVTPEQAGQWRRDGARIARMPGGLAVYSRAYPDTPAEIRRTRQQGRG